MTEARKQVLDLIAANSRTLTGNLNNFWTRSLEDLAGGGVPRSELAESMFTVGLTYKMLVEGKPHTIAHLRALADFLEKSLPPGGLAQAVSDDPRRPH